MFSHRNDNVGAFNTPSGWSDIVKQTDSAGQDRQVYLGYKVAGSSEGAVTLTHTDTANEQWSGCIITFRGVDTTSPLDVAYSSSHHVARTNKATTNVDAFQNIVTVTDGAWVLALEAVTHDDITSDADPSGYTSIVRHYGGAIDHRQFQAWYKQVSPAGSETPGAPPYTSNNTQAESNQFTLALRPAAVASANPVNPLGHPLTGPFGGPVA